MGKNIIYRYNPDTDNYERVFPSAKSRLLGVLRIAVWSLIFGAVMFVIAFYGLSSPTEESLREENSRLRSQLKGLDDRLENALAVMEDIRARDDNFYRVMMQMDPVSNERRYAGLKTSARAGDDKMMRDISTRLSLLEQGLYSQSSSFDSLRNAVKGQKEKLAHIPSILPLRLADFTVSSGYGNRIDPIYETVKFHAGLDFPADTGSDVFATADGTVAFAGWRGEYGNCVDIDHGYNYVTRYGHLSKIDVRQGQTVRRGDKVGGVGSSGKSTGPHLHYEVRYKDQPQNPVNFYFMDLTPEQYNDMIKQAANAGRVMD